MTELTEPKQHSLSEEKAKEGEKSSDTLSKDEIISVPGKYELKLLASFEAFMNHKNTFPFSSPNTKTPVKYAANPEGSTALISLIPSCWAPTTPFFIFNQNLGSLKIFLGFFGFFFPFELIGLVLVCFVSRLV